MARATGTDLVFAMETGRLTSESWAGMVTACRGCSRTEECGRWLARMPDARTPDDQVPDDQVPDDQVPGDKVHDAGPDIPSWCVNRATFSELRAGPEANGKGNAE